MSPGDADAVMGFSGIESVSSNEDDSPPRKIMGGPEAGAPVSKAPVMQMDATDLSVESLA
jgi:hypothetical protein